MGIKIKSADKKVAKKLADKIIQLLHDELHGFNGVSDAMQKVVDSTYALRQAEAYLAKDLDLPSVILKTALEKLSIIPGGTISRNPSELLSSKRMSELIIEAKERYNDRYILVDTPPPLITAEASAIARIVDGIIIVVSANHTNRDKVSNLLDVLGRKKVLGVVINRYEVSGSKYYGYSQSKYHKK